METSEHRRTIIHIDLDCFYAQVEMIKNPSLYELPLGIQQKNIIVTSNYLAREKGVGKCMKLSEALKACRNLRIVNGEDLHDYRKVSYEVTAYLRKYSELVERLGLDENYVDVTRLVETRLNSENIEVVGNVFPASNEPSETCHCECGCETRLKVGTQIAQEMRQGLKNELKLTSCAGIAHNKLLAKLVGAKHKPNQQSVVFPYSAVELLLSLKNVDKVPGIGTALSEILNKINVHTVEELQNCSFETLRYEFNVDLSKFT